MLFYRPTCFLHVFELVLLVFDQVLSQCEPLEEGNSHVITCSGSRRCNNHLLYRWIARKAGQPERLISHCDTTLGCTGNNEFFAISVTPDGSGYQSNLTIDRVSLTQPFSNELTWACEYCGRITETCPLEIFVKPVNPTCQSSEILDGNGQLTKINLTCVMQNVYPEPICRFETVGEGDTNAIPQQSGNPCNTAIDVGVLKDGDNVIRAKVGSSRQPDFDSILPIPVTPNIRLWVPKTRVECPNFEYSDGFYRGESVECQCSLTDPGKPQGNPAWFRNNGQNRLTTSTLTFSFQNGPPEPIICAGYSAIGRESPGISFSPQFAFIHRGTTNFTTIYEDRPLDSCCGNAGVLAICEIASSDVNPTPRIQFLINDVATINSNSQDKRDENYRNILRFRPQIGGIFRVVCRVENAIFPEFAEDSAVNITIHSPVQFAESEEVRTHYSVKIDPGTSVVVETVITAYPKATIFTLYRGSPAENTTADNYEVDYKEISPSSGKVELTMSVNSSLDLTMYSLVIDNGIGKGLIYSFTLGEDSEDDVRIVYIVVGVVAGVLLIVAVVVFVLCWRKRRTKQGDDVQKDDDKSEDSPEDEENIYNEPEDDKLGEKYATYVLKDGIPPLNKSSKPPKTSAAKGKTGVKKGLEQSKIEGLSPTSEFKGNPMEIADGQKPKTAGKSTNKTVANSVPGGYCNVEGGDISSNPKEDAKKIAKDTTDGPKRAAAEKADTDAPKSGYYNIRDGNTESGNAEPGIDPPGPSSSNTQGNETYVNIPAAQAVSDTSDSPAQPYRNIPSWGLDPADEHLIYSSITEGVCEADRVMY